MIPSPQITRCLPATPINPNKEHNSIFLKIQLFISAEHDDRQSISLVEGIAAIVR